MAYGFKCRNRFGYFLIDDDYENLLVRHEGSITTSAEDEMELRYATVTLAADTPVLAFRSSVLVNTFCVDLGNGMRRFGFRTKEPASVQYWVFDKAVYARKYGSSQRYGLIVRKSDGTVVFDSRARAMRVADLVSGNGAVASPEDPIEGGFSRSYSGKSPIVVQMQARSWGALTLVGVFPNLDALMQVWHSGARVSGSTVQFGMIPGARTFPSGTATPEWVTNYELLQYNYMILDISNFY